MPPVPADDGLTVPWRLTEATSSDRRVLARSSMLVAGRVVSKLAILVFLVVAARLLTKAEYGVYSYVLVLAYTFALLADAQVSVIAGRDVAAGRRSAAEAYWSALPIVLAGGVLAAVGMLLFGLADDGPGTTASMLFAAGAFVVCNRLFWLGLDMLRALGRFRAEVLIETAGTLLLVGVATATVEAGLGVAAVLGVFAIHSLLGAVVCHALLRREIESPVAVPGYRGSLLRSGIKLALAVGATAVATRAPLITLGLAASAVTVAGYSAAMRFSDGVYLLALTAGQSLLPSIASLLSTDVRRAARLTRRGIVLTTALGTVLALGLAPFGSDIIGVIFGDTYSSAGPLMSVMMASVPFMGMFWISWFALCAHGRERDVLLVSVVCATGCVLASVIVIPDGGPRGAAWIYSGALAALALGTYAMFERQVRMAKPSVA
jgi:O-antigen/teichoic acid export membrane protein